MKRATSGTGGTGELTPGAQEPVALPDVGVLVLQVTVGPDQGLRGEDHLVSGLLELLQQLFGAGGENHVIAVGKMDNMFASIKLAKGGYVKKRSGC